MKKFLTLPIILISILAAGQAIAQDTTDTATPPATPVATPPASPPAAPPRPAAAAPTPAAAEPAAAVSTDVTAKPKLMPKQYIANFYQSFADERAEPNTNKARNGLLALLTSNDSLTARGIEQIAGAIQGPLGTVGEFIDYKVAGEEDVTDRIQVIRVIAHFTNQPFMNEFTFYKKEDGYWGLVNLRYDANLATMFND
ncbi:MAG: hypothetical protein ACI8UO_001825 [Verrucomicrobiales bacterium]|jgi:hypothetical protein